MADESRTLGVLERVFLRLTLADDSKLTGILKNILPMLLGLFKPGQQVYIYALLEQSRFLAFESILPTLLDCPEKKYGSAESHSQKNSSKQIN